MVLCSCITKANGNGHKYPKGDWGLAVTEREEYRRAPSSKLPPQEFWLHNPFKDEPLPTPLDERGMVDPVQLVKLVRSTVDPAWNFPKTFSNRHHLQWPNAQYRRYDSEGNLDMVFRRFRGLSSRSITIEDTPHTWLHLVTAPPGVPDYDKMVYMIEAEDVALSLFEQVRSSKRIARMKKLGMRGVEDQLLRRLDTFEAKFDQAKSLPAEFQLIDFSKYKIDKFEDMLEIGTRLGKHAVKRTGVWEFNEQLPGQPSEQPLDQVA